jgi:putative ABC transport system substrate-binding protein
MSGITQGGRAESYPLGATMFDPDVAPHAPPFLRSIDAASRTLGMETIAASVRTDAEAEAAVASLGRDGDGALVVIPDTFTYAHRQTIIRSAESHRVPAIYPDRVFADDGGFMAYADNIAEQYRGAATYVDRILKGAKPACDRRGRSAPIRKAGTFAAAPYDPVDPKTA